MKVIVTGSNGFIGSALVNELLKLDFEVVAVVRKDKNLSEHHNLTVLVCDFSKPIEEIADELAGSDCIINLASEMAMPDRSLGALIDNVLLLAEQLDVPKFIHVSSLSVLKYTDKKPMSVIDELTDIETDLDSLGFYAQMKCKQELQVVAWGNNFQKPILICRPGIVYSKNKLPRDHAGAIMKGYVFGVHHDGQVPVVSLDSVVQALILMVRVKESKYSIYNLVDGRLPCQDEYINALKLLDSKLSFLFIINWKVFLRLTRIFRSIFSLNNYKSMPDFLRKNSVHARFTPFKFSNDLAVNYLRWKPELFSKEKLKRVEE